ncbi:MAG: polysaccharide biosynthesis protein [Rhodothermales bacterium]
MSTVHLADLYLPSPVQIEDLLQRPPAACDAARLREYLGNRRVLVTGAGGSIGRELTLQLLQLAPRQLALVDFSEYNLFQLEQTVHGVRHRSDLSYHLLDVRQAGPMTHLFETFRPDVVFHTAAYKHVPMMEAHPIEAFQNNTLASVELLRLSEAYGAEQFIFISTDKAVQPTSFMGATKRWTERYMRAASGAVRTKTVRFGNVFGSLGSVVPVFVQQILHGGPVTVTHEAMERFFMSVHDACTLILETLLLENAPVYTLRMDPPVRIKWLAERLIERLTPAGARPIALDYIGIRPGEKIKEMLWEDYEEPVPTTHRDIIGLRSPAASSRSELDAQLRTLAGFCTHRRADDLRALLFEDELSAQIA